MAKYRWKNPKDFLHEPIANLQWKHVVTNLVLTILSVTIERTRPRKNIVHNVFRYSTLNNINTRFCYMSAFVEKNMLIFPRESGLTRQTISLAGQLASSLSYPRRKISPVNTWHINHKDHARNCREYRKITEINSSKIIFRTLFNTFMS